TLAISCYYFVFFFFQAEDGIRDFHVTGVQTCALPISARSRNRSGRFPGPSMPPLSPRGDCTRASAGMDGVGATLVTARLVPGRRSEERRVGKECRSRCAPSH